ncbi:type II secretion system F family protein [Nitriliruptor alkaliphilus]|uniref:type II secretion system F family protein n=1 Tax=Nitriliruptor alkaliphilus TaxID=427918 RepID=UPI000697D217|nr:type II secretion system F family protein [Nitriliruptor alkaliphilus]
MTGLLVLSGLTLWVGLTLLLAEVRWFSRPPLTDRLAPFVPGGDEVPRRSGWWSVATVSEVIAPLARDIGAAVGRAVGVTEDLGRRLRRVHATADPTSFRVRQLGVAAAAFAAAVLLAVLLRLPLLLAVAVPTIAALLALLLVEQRLLTASAAWQRALTLELPVVTEQLAMRMGAGASLTVALERVASRGRGAVARDLTRVTARIRQGVAADRALAEWADLAAVDAVTRLVSVLQLDRDTGDLGRLLAAEARTLRQEQHRHLIEVAEKRGQQVWVPVTVAALVPGTVFIAIPFASAISQLFG